MPKTDTLIRTKLRLPFTRLELVARPRLQARISEGLSRPLTLITAPAGFGKTTLLAACIAGSEMPVAWLALDQDDNRVRRFLSYLVAGLQQADRTIGREATQLLEGIQPAAPEAVLTSLINDLDAAGREIALVLDDYQFISDQAVHEAVAFLLEYCPKTFHLVIATRSDPPLPIARLRARGQTVELRAADLRFSEPEAAQFLNDIMGLNLDASSIAVLAERTEGWIAGLQMAALSMRDREDVFGFIEGFSGTNRYILDYLLEEVLASQPPEMQFFLLCTSILERLTAPLCEAILEVDGLEDRIIDQLSATFQPTHLLNCQPILEHLERSNLFLVPLDETRQWYRYHHLFADLLRTQMNQVYPGLAPQLHARAARWFEQNDLILEAIQHASMAADDEKVERLIEQNYLEMLNRREMSEVRYWMGKLSKELVYRRPWLCLYEAFSRSWFGKLEEANLLLDNAEKRIRADDSVPETQAMLGYHDYVKSRVTAMQGDTRRAIEYCLAAREQVPADNLGMQIEVGITLGYEYSLVGDFINADKTLKEMIRACYPVRAINNPVAAYALRARLHILQGQLHAAYDLFQEAAQLIHEAHGQHLGVTGLVKVGLAALSCEWNDMKAALDQLEQGMELLPAWGKADDLCLAYITLARIQFALGNPTEATAAIDKAAQLMQTCGVFSEARSAIESSQVKMWLYQGDWQAVGRWVEALEKRLGAEDTFRFEDELARITWARAWIAQDQPEEAIRLFSSLEASARAGSRHGRLIEILMLKALALQMSGEAGQADIALTESLMLAEPEGYLRIFLDEGRSMQQLLAEWQRRAKPGPSRDCARRILSEFEVEPQVVTMAQAKPSPTRSRVDPEVRPTEDALVEPLSPREQEVLQLIAQGKTNKEIARKLVVAPGTVKAHTASIYRKLDVTNRTEAAARARQFGLLP